MAESLRALLESPQQHAAFTADGIADVPVGAGDIHHKLSAMHRGLVAHDALNASLQRVFGIPPLDKLLDAIKVARDQDLISKAEEKWLRHFNQVANEAKHQCATAFPF